MKTFKLFALSAALLALAFPHAAGTVLSWLTVIAGVLFGHLAATLTLAGVALLLRVAHRVSTWSRRANSRRLARDLAAIIPTLSRS